MVKAIPMEDWLRGCVYHDGRHGEVILPTDKVLQIANYIQRTRRSVSDGLIDLEVEPIADTPQTDDKDINVRSKDEPQKDCKKCKNYDRCKNNRWKCCVYEPKDEPQTDCGWR